MGRLTKRDKRILGGMGALMAFGVCAIGYGQTAGDDGVRPVGAPRGDSRALVDVTVPIDSARPAGTPTATSGIGSRVAAWRVTPTAGRSVAPVADRSVAPAGGQTTPVVVRRPVTRAPVTAIHRPAIALPAPTPAPSGHTTGVPVPSAPAGGDAEPGTAGPMRPPAPPTPTPGPPRASAGAETPPAVQPTESAMPGVAGLAHLADLPDMAGLPHVADLPHMADLPVFGPAGSGPPPR